MAREIERKFLPTDDRWRDHVTRSREVAQGYLAVTGRGNVRVRRAGDLGYLTVKGRRGPAGRDEFEYPIPVADADVMLRTLCETAIIRKSRHDVQVGLLHIEVDEFHEANAGLVLAEIELEHPDALPDDLPEWLGPDVTDDERYYNAHLSRAPFGSW